MGKGTIKEGDWVKVPGHDDDFDFFQVVVCAWGVVKVRQGATFLFFKEML